jgi:hypothetical protein
MITHTLVARQWLTMYAYQLLSLCEYSYIVMRSMNINDTWKLCGGTLDVWV